jgi:DnaJ family protein C protein 7
MHELIFYIIDFA